MLCVVNEPLHVNFTERSDPILSIPTKAMTDEDWIRNITYCDLCGGVCTGRGSLVLKGKTQLKLRRFVGRSVRGTKKEGQATTTTEVQ